MVADPVRITQVLDNLVTNAIRYGGPNVHVSAARAGSSVRLTVSDDGIGVPDELVDTLFEAYVHGTASHALGGSGLGLLIVRQLCEAMNGTIEYDGTHGTRFTATFPALPVPTAEIGADVADAGHSVAFWHTEDRLTESVVSYVANGLAEGEAVLVAATPDHLRLLEKGLGSGRHRPRRRDRDRTVHALRCTCAPRGARRRSTTSTANASTRSSARTIEQVSSRWRSFRVFGEIVDLYWRRSEANLALELEACWNELRAEHPFPLLCGYELAPGRDRGTHLRLPRHGSRRLTQLGHGPDNHSTAHRASRRTR